MPKIAEYPRRTSDWLKSEPTRFTCETGVLASGQGKIDTGTVLGRIKVGAATAAAVAGGTGDGTLTVDATTPVLAGAQAGVYLVKCVEAAANGGRFEVNAPGGEVIGLVNVGETFAEQIKFAIADGAADFVVGDAFEVTVALGSEKYVVCDPTATDGSEKAVAITWRYHDVTSADRPDALLVVRDAEVAARELIWHANHNAASKDAALKQLAEARILARAAH